MCHSKTKDLASHTLKADIIVTAVGNREKFELKPEMIKEGAIIIDFAITRYNGALAGDCDYEKIIRISNIKYYCIINFFDNNGIVLII